MPDPPFRPVIHTQADLEQMWRRLMSPLGFARHTIWMVVVRDDRPIPQVMEIVETPDAPEPDDVAAFAGVLELLARPDTRFAFLRSARVAAAPTRRTAPGHEGCTTPGARQERASTWSTWPTTTTSSRSSSTTFSPIRRDVGTVSLTSTAVSGGTGSMGVRRNLLAAASALAAPLLLALSACGDDNSVANPPIQSGPASSSTHSAQPESPEHFIRRFYAAEKAMENTGRTSEYRRLAASCRSCTSLSHDVAAFYSAGGYVRWAGMRIQTIRPYSKSQQGQTFAVKGVAAPTRYKSSSNASVQTLTGGPTTELVTVADPRGSLRVTAFAKLAGN
jgi:hypothetical protein